MTYKVRCDCGETFEMYTRERAEAVARQHADAHLARMVRSIEDRRYCPFRPDKLLGACDCHRVNVGA